jgi:hypothetical protein
MPSPGWERVRVRVMKRICERKMMAARGVVSPSPHSFPIRERKPAVGDNV